MKSIVKKIHKYLYLYPKIKICILVNKIYYSLLLKFNDVGYDVLPRINGRLRINNNGKIEFGNNLVFNSTFYSNPIGLNKPCTIFVDENATLVIGSGSGFSGISIFCSKKIIIGKMLFCGANVSIWDTDFHPIPVYERINNIPDTTRVKEIKIGDNVFIGANSIILKGVVIGDGSVIGAGSVVTKNIPPNQIWAGNPAKFIKVINNDVEINNQL